MGIQQQLKITLFSTFLLLSVVYGQTIYGPMNSQVFSPMYSAEWQTINELDGALKLQVSLTIQALPYDTWSDQNQDGVWLGIGFGSQVMVGSDIVMCEFKFSGTAAADKFICSDRKASAYSIPPKDTTENVVYVNTQKNFDPVTKTCTLIATFKRNLYTDDQNDQDFKLRDGDTVDALWAWGYIQSNNPQGHGSSDLKRDGFRMRLFSISEATMFGMSCLFSIIAMFAAMILI
ncbi:UNKNOWN [Stylonychia lemnae]|uniref:DOMON domain-containing protein n=1 Tax=Stylonychia lemnae TaxID=5949 RepID=A0A078AN33_STYLE|nr:UNKNOWN [Stylonychia lemnae]|eukprot:CDW82313.1 UNKNOWN [Stylonychia lemnae]